MKNRLGVFVAVFLVLALAPEAGSQGNEWIRLGVPEGGHIDAIAVSENRIFAAARDKVFLSDDRGNTWREIVGEQAFGLDSRSSLVVTGGDLYCIEFFSGQKYRSLLAHYRNDGSEWTRVPVNSPKAFWYPYDKGLIEGLVAIGKSLYLFGSERIYRSNDGGLSWSKIGRAPFKAGDLRCVAAAGGRLFASDGAALRVSKNGGASWSAVRPGWPKTESIRDLAGTDSELLALSDKGIFRTRDGGASWDSVRPGSAARAVPLSLATGAGLLCAGTTLGVFLSTDGGASWGQANSGLRGDVIHRLGWSRRGLLAQTDQGLFLSSDDGASWTAVGAPLFPGWNVKYIGPSGAGHYAVGPSPRVEGRSCLYVSNDDARTWKAVGPDLPEEISLYFDPIYRVVATDTTLVVDAGVDVLITEPGGTHWSELKAGFPEKTTVFGLVSKGVDLFAHTGDGLYRSTDRGVTWKTVSAGWPDKTWAGSLAVCGTDLYVGTARGVLVSRDDGASWKIANRGLPRNRPEVSALVTDGIKLYAGTGDGIYMSADGGESWSRVGGDRNVLLGNLVIGGSNLYTWLHRFFDGGSHAARLPLR